jgi:DNA-3-methyladenine glycosylase II
MYRCFYSLSRARAEVGRYTIRLHCGLILVDERNLIPVPMRKAILHLKKSDPVLKAIIDRVGAYGIQYRDPCFETLVRSIVYQQLSGKVASVIFGRLAEAAKGQITPESMLKLTPARMRKCGLSKQKTAYIRDLAKKTSQGSVRFEALAGLADHEVIEHLVQVKGVGVWTAHMFLMFALQRTDVLPTGDLGIRTAMKKAYELEALPLPKQMEELAWTWRPYCSVASWYLWRSLEGPAEL